MSNSLSLTINIDGSGALGDTSAIVNPATEYFRIGNGVSGSGQFPSDALGLAPSLVMPSPFTPQADQWYQAQRTLGAGAYDLLNLQAATGGLINGLGQSLDLTYVQWLLLVLIDHDGTKKLQVGPQGQTHAWPAWFEAATANFFDTFYWLYFLANDAGSLGPALTSTTNILPIYNPTGSSITYSIFVGGN